MRERRAGVKLVKQFDGMDMKSVNEERERRETREKIYETAVY